MLHYLLVPRTGLEPVTQEFSVLCSTIGATVAINNFMINFNSAYIRHANETLYWWPMDTEELYLKNLQENRLALRHGNWIDRVIEYKFNSHGFRSEEFTDDPNIMFLGCSHTFGIGLPAEDRWTDHVAAALNLKCYNLGIPGGSTDGAFRLCYGWIDKLKPKIVIFRKPPGIRIEMVDEAGSWNIRIGSLPAVIEHTWLLQWGKDDNNHLLNYLKNTIAMQKICEDRKTKLIILDESNDVEFCDAARDLMHYGTKTNKRYADNVLSIIENSGGSPGS